MRKARIVHRAALLGALSAAVIGSVSTSAVAAQTATAHLQGRVVSVNGDSLTLHLRDGKEQKLDITAARAAHRTGALAVGAAVIVYGTRDASGVFHVTSIAHSSPDPKQWSPDD